MIILRSDFQSSQEGSNECRKTSYSRKTAVLVLKPKREKKTRPWLGGIPVVQVLPEQNEWFYVVCKKYLAIP